MTVPKFNVTITRSAYTNLTYVIEAATSDAAEEIVSEKIDDNDISALGVPVHEETHDDEESAWEIIDVEEAEGG